MWLVFFLQWHCKESMRDWIRLVQFQHKTGKIFVLNVPSLNAKGFRETLWMKLLRREVIVSASVMLIIEVKLADWLIQWTKCFVVFIQAFYALNLHLTKDPLLLILLFGLLNQIHVWSGETVQVLMYWMKYLLCGIYSGLLLSEFSHSHLWQTWLYLSKSVPCRLTQKSILIWNKTYFMSKIE